MDFLKIKVRWVIKKDNKIFLCKIANAWFYCLPWWTLEKWETIKQCLEREIIEELWIKPIIWELIKVYEFFTNEWNTWIDFWFEILNFQDFKKIDLKSSTHWFELSEVWFYDLQQLKDFKPVDLLELVKNKSIYQ